MTIEEIQELVNSPTYDFLRTDPYLGSRIALLTLGGSHAYGTNTEDSDVDVRGCALESKRELLTNRRFEQVINNETDTTIYGFNKLISLLSNCNPNTIEMLGCKPEHYLYISEVGKQLLNNKHLFLSRQAVFSFGGYATQQLRRLDNKSARLVGQAEQERHILNSIRNAAVTFPEKYFSYSEDAIRLYLDTSDQEDYEMEIYMDVNLRHYPLRDYKCMWSEMHNIVKDYARIGKRNKNAIARDKLGKHMMHLIRLYMMCLDILEREEIVTYREAEHEVLMDIRNGKYLDLNEQPTSEFMEMVDEYERKLDYAKENTGLPAKPDYAAIEDFMMVVNEKIIKED